MNEWFRNSASPPKQQKMYKGAMTWGSGHQQGASASAWWTPVLHNRDTDITGDDRTLADLNCL